MFLELNSREREFSASSFIHSFQIINQRGGGSIDFPVKTMKRWWCLSKQRAMMLWCYVSVCSSQLRPSSFSSKSTTFTCSGASSRSAPCGPSYAQVTWQDIWSSVLQRGSGWGETWTWTWTCSWRGVSFIFLLAQQENEILLIYSSE